MNRTQKLLTGLLALQVILLVLWHSPLAGNANLPVEPHPLLPGVEGMTPARIAIGGGEDRSVTLVHGDEGWGIEEAGGYPADATKVQELLDKLKGLEVRRPVVTSPRYFEALKVTEEDHERSLRIWTAPSGDPEMTLYLGTSPNYRVTHVRREGENAVYEVHDLGAYDLRDSAGGWITTRLLDDAGMDDVVGFRVTNASGAFALEKGTDGGWKVTEGSGRPELDATKIDSLLRTVTNLTIADPEGPVDPAAQGLESPAATLVLRLQEKPEEPAPGEGDAEGAEEEAAQQADEEAEPTVREITLVVGAKVADKDSQRYVRRADSPYAVRVWNGSVDRLVDGKVKDFAPSEG